MKFQYLTLIEDEIAYLTLNRPEKLNAFNPALFMELGQGLEQLDNNEKVKVVVITGSGKAFSAGGDINTILDNSSKNIPAINLVEGIKRGQAIIHKVMEMEKPTIASINGDAVGAGVQLASLCDFRIASQGARFGVGDVKIGIIPALGATQWLPLLIGVAKAKEMIMIGDLITADEALEIGLINKVVPPESLQAETQALARKIMSRAPLAVKMAKKLIQRGLFMAPEEALHMIAEGQANLMVSEDCREGMSAFLSKRPPQFKGK
ncbi:MAG: enoyl-CoA hydratase/isomerase family protein [Candidatus Tectomicrobia bacterium]|uniref:Enoyl-CoA hydratase/isomerase family protein n=1 Tax=Tectimicrobiota bacterium TaxID=2528274 RepID=A0A933LPV7_UNCTE|nr:enoyl-CoA hydratase/isomerase family protein [Candidatus Tectomicrobia bacterium]